jgi:integrase
MNDVDLPWYKISKYLGEYISIVKDRAYTREEIRQILTKADERMRVVVLLLASTGMRISAIPDLTIRSLAKIEEYSLYQIKVYEGTSDEYYCFCSKECTIAIDSYLLYRSRFGEQLTPDSPLIREQFRPSDLFRIKNPKKLSYRTMGNNLDNLLIKSGVHNVVHITEGGGGPHHGRERKLIARSNGFRKFVITNMIRAKVDFVSREMLVGHNTGLDKSYYRPGTNELLSEYLKILDLVTIDEENRLKITVEELTQKSKDNEYIIKAKLQEKDDQIKAITDQFSQMQDQMQSLLSSLGSMNENEKSYFAKQLFNSGIYKKDYG